jgi:hypothetical protein
LRIEISTLGRPLLAGSRGEDAGEHRGRSGRRRGPTEAGATDGNPECLVVDLAGPDTRAFAAIVVRGASRTCRRSS